METRLAKTPPPHGPRRSELHLHFCRTTPIDDGRSDSADQESPHRRSGSGFNVEKAQYKNVAYCVWDVDRQENLGPLWKMHLSNSDALDISQMKRDN
ncbi:uncharacterized protein [Lolium perenne]|uniref:uncharacterized protein n=1 Tax=Lolium perenne TaxID=4522 RepID=UPI0021F59181|nr:uncharacterized protein LOC127295436 isoform X2 [Lolium perenne]